MKKLLLSALTVSMMGSCMAHAETINVLRSGPSGAGLGLWSESVADTLRNNDYKVNLVAFNNCKESDKWIAENPNKPFIYLTYSDYSILQDIKPDHPAACGQPLNEKTLITIIGQWWNFICGKKDKNDSIEALVANREAKVGVWNYPISHAVAKAHVKALGSEANVIGFSSGKTMMTAFNTGDIDYIIMSSENLANSLHDASCFGTSANIEDAQKYMPTRTSYETVKGVPFIGYGLWPVLAGGNVNTAKIREIFAVNPSLSYVTLASNFIPDTRPVTEQIEGLKTLGKQLNTLLD